MYYHITTKENAKKILKEGLKPMIGPNSQLIDEKEPAIYLCKHKDVPYWQIILQRFVVLAINEQAVHLNDDSHFNYSLYSEYIIRHEIGPEHIKRVYLSNNREKQNKDLCLDYIYSLSRYCEVCARWYDDAESKRPKIQEWFDEIKFNSKLYKKILPNLDYSKVDKKDIREQIREMGENCCYTICDYFYDENKRLYQKLIEYPKDELTEDRTFVYNFIKTNLKGCLRIETGGWCGC